jgi:hypothetical protein
MNLGHVLKCAAAPTVMAFLEELARCGGGSGRHYWGRVIQHSSIVTHIQVPKETPSGIITLSFRSIEGAI